MMIRRMVFSRNRYFHGRLLTASDFEAEQDYLRDKQQFRNLHTHGMGIVSGLSVKTRDAGKALYISSGFAIDRLGREICVPSTVECALSTKSDRLLLCLGYAETEAKPTPSSRNEATNEGSPAEYARIEEGYEVTLTPIPRGRRSGPQPILPSQSEPSALIPLAVLQRKGMRWVVESSPRRPRMKSARTKPMKGKGR